MSESNTTPSPEYNVMAVSQLRTRLLLPEGAKQQQAHVVSGFQSGRGIVQCLLSATQYSVAMNWAPNMGTRSVRIRVLLIAKEEVSIIKSMLQGAPIL